MDAMDAMEIPLHKNAYLVPRSSLFSRGSGQSVDSLQIVIQPSRIQFYNVCCIGITLWSCFQIKLTTTSVLLQNIKYVLHVPMLHMIEFIIYFFNYAYTEYFIIRR